MALIDELKQARIECDEQYKRVIVDHAFYAERLNDLDTAIAALQQGEVMITVTNDEPDESAAIAALEPAPTEPEAVLYSIDEQTCEPVDPRCGAPADQSEEEPTEFISILTGDPAVEPESGLHGEPEPTELDAPASILDDPELQATATRLEATLADADDDETLSRAAYVGLQDPDLDAEYEAMREREKADRKLHFSIFGKREEV